ncbi:MAG: hypothetical protein J5978_09455, partial [Spirochaetaceae bacterium]|nr:hypothetical protein [Spirochaetaceae bacterium]
DFTLKDNSTKIIFNALDYQKENNLEIKSILEYLINRNSTNDFTDKINQQVEKLKYDERFKGEYMMVNLHEWELSERAKKQGWEEGEKYGAEQKAIETAKNALKNNIPIEMIVKITGLTENKVLALQKEIGE